MKNLAPLLAGLFAWGCAQSPKGTTAGDWVFVGESESMVAYVNPATIRRSGNMVRMWGLFDFKTVQENPIADKPYFSEKTQIEYDCKGERTRILYLQWHSGQMGAGDVIYDELGPDRWIPVSPGSVIQLLWTIACGKTSAAGEDVVTPPKWSGAAFIRAPIGSGASIEIPDNWVVLSEDQRASTDALVAAQEGRKFGFRLGFAATLNDERGKPMALVNARLYPANPITQADMGRVTPNQIKDLEVQVRTTTEALNTVTNWYGFKTQVINGLYVLVYEYQHSRLNEADLMRTRVLQIWRGEQSFAVELTYRERDALMLRPIIDYMAGSVQQD